MSEIIPNIKNNSKVIVGLLILVCCTFPYILFGQNNFYTISFETGITHPAIKSYSSTDTVWADSIPWKMPGVFLGTMTNNDFYNGNHAARFRLTNNTSGNPAYMEMLTDLPNGIQEIHFFAAMYGTETGGKLSVSYSTDSGQTWVPVGDTFLITATHDSAMEVDWELAVNQPVRIKIQKVNTDDSRIDVDDISISRYGTGDFVLINDKQPTGSQVSIFTDSLKIHFDHPVIQGNGQLSLYRSEGGIQNIAIPSAQIFTHDSTVVVSGIQLQDNSHYYVLLSDSAFVDTLNNLYSKSVTDTFFWRFETEDTIAPPHILPLTSLSESFLACNESQNLIGLFKSYSVAGNQVWQCTSEGHGDSFAVAISGGFGIGISANNEDWLISELPFDLSAMQNPILSFWQKGIYGGNVVRTVKISMDYPGRGNPDADSVHWITLNIPGINQEPDQQWNLIDGINLSAFRNQIFYLAFTYSCGTDGAYKLFYDDMNIQNPTGIFFNPSESFTVKVLGMPNNRQLTYQIISEKYGGYNLAVYDLQGNVLISTFRNIRKSISAHTLPLKWLPSGLYLLRIWNDSQSAIARFLIP